MSARFVVLAVVAAAAVASVARADDSPPTITVRALAFGGAGETRLTSGRYGAASVDLGLEGVYWFAHTVGIGLLLGSGTYVPFDTRLSHDDDVLELELTVRRELRRIENGVVSFQGSAGIGAAIVRTMDSSSVTVVDDHRVGHPMELSQADHATASIAGCIELDVHWVALALGARAEVNGGDWAIGPYLGLGAVF